MEKQKNILMENYHLKEVIKLEKDLEVVKNIMKVNQYLMEIMIKKEKEMDIVQNLMMVKKFMKENT